MSKKNVTYKTLEKKKTDNSFTLKGGYIRVKIDNINDHLQNVSRGAGVIQSPKVYNRKKNNRLDDNYDCSSSFSTRKCASTGIQIICHLPLKSIQSLVYIPIIFEYKNHLTL